MMAGKGGTSSDSERVLLRHTAGLCALLLAGAILAIGLMEATYGAPFRMPRSWYAHKPLWMLFGVVLLVGGSWLQRSGVASAPFWRPSVSGKRFHRLVIYSREDCHLCELAHETLAEYSEYLPEIEEIDIDTDPQLQAEFGVSIPVVEIDGQIRFRGRVDEVLLQRLIEGTPPAGAVDGVG